MGPQTYMKLSRNFETIQKHTKCWNFKRAFRKNWSKSKKSKWIMKTQTKISESWIKRNRSVQLSLQKKKIPYTQLNIWCIVRHKKETLLYFVCFCKKISMKKKQENEMSKYYWENLWTERELLKIEILDSCRSVKWVSNDSMWD